VPPVEKKVVGRFDLKKDEALAQGLVKCSVETEGTGD